MSHVLMKVALGAVAALMLGGAVQAGEYGNPFAGDRESYRAARSYGDADGYGAFRSVREHRDHGYRDPGRYYGRPVPERPHWDRHRWSRPHWQHGDDCRLIVKRHVNQWGDLVVTRIRRCA